MLKLWPKKPSDTTPDPEPVSCNNGFEIAIQVNPMWQHLAGDTGIPVYSLLLRKSEKHPFIGISAETLTNELIEIANELGGVLTEDGKSFDIDRVVAASSEDAKAAARLHLERFANDLQRTALPHLNSSVIAAVANTIEWDIKKRQVIGEIPCGEEGCSIIIRGMNGHMENSRSHEPMRKYSLYLQVPEGKRKSLEAIPAFAGRLQTDGTFSLPGDRTLQIAGEPSLISHALGYIAQNLKGANLTLPIEKIQDTMLADMQAFEKQPASQKR